MISMSSLYSYDITETNGKKLSLPTGYAPNSMVPNSNFVYPTRIYTHRYISKYYIYILMEHVRRLELMLNRKINTGTLPNVLKYNDWKPTSDKVILSFVKWIFSWFNSQYKSTPLPISWSKSKNTKNTSFGGKYGILVRQDTQTWLLIPIYRHSFYNMKKYYHPSHETESTMMYWLFISVSDLRDNYFKLHQAWIYIGERDNIPGGHFPKFVSNPPGSPMKPQFFKITSSHESNKHHKVTPFDSLDDNQHMLGFTDNKIKDLLSKRIRNSVKNNKARCIFTDSKDNNNKKIDFETDCLISGGSWKQL